MERLLDKQEADARARGFYVSRGPLTKSFAASDGLKLKVQHFDQPAPTLRRGDVLLRFSNREMRRAVSTLFVPSADAQGQCGGETNVRDRLTPVVIYDIVNPVRLAQYEAERERYATCNVRSPLLFADTEPYFNEVLKNTPSLGGRLRSKPFNEKVLLHGTPPGAVTSIITTRLTANEGAYGRAIYLTDLVCKAATYSYQVQQPTSQLVYPTNLDLNGILNLRRAEERCVFMLVCRTLLGCVANGWQPSVGKVPGRTLSQPFDSSIVAEKNRPREFLIPQEGQDRVLPIAVVGFRKA